MPDLSAEIARMLIDGEGIPPSATPLHRVSLILDRWLDATIDEIHRGFLIAIETQTADNLMEGVRHA